ncbi:Pyridoxal phosphate phosphatase, putative [Perkinsus marinus ATCC 50983]|uniref:Pyridoxal phosphate phosphatase, putative n=1 Tax=Perkinsus marinus (strain ATCC 50983 / TXsc) TaxID=423536 RepID=C5L509_PERM5|nr:Pyridoxal phosphate phosphatase, putative [Perkinsus marinus ATCC 50983]EER08229.1 Pyridoxal phosphate phosphatase, putative [Perkinsus marinus ATCC 50983]|eukprot:XP_002776413.1 Pyridoxal phosphate phosphatase, putative [Perkinsus marinus ATCC 50983]
MPSNHVTCIDDVVANYDNIIFDCDGVIWQGGHLIPGVDKCLKALNDAGKESAFMTNTSSRSRAGMRAKFGEMGLGELCSEKMMFPSCFYTAKLIQRRHPHARRGEPLGEERFRIIAEEMARELNSKIDGIVVGWDLAFSFEKICRASLAFQMAGEEFFFYATNDDSFDRMGPWKIPATGVILASINAAARFSDRQDAQVLGKPNPEFVRISSIRCNRFCNAIATTSARPIRLPLLTI